MTTTHPVFWIMAAAVLAPLLSELPLRLRVPVVVLEVLLGIVLGPHVLGLVALEGFTATMYAFGMAATLFVAGMELDFKKIAGQPLWLALRGWGLSLLLALGAAALLYATPWAREPLLLTLALCTTALGTLLPLLRDAGRLAGRFGHLFIAAGTIGEIGPIVAMSLVLSQRYTTWQEIGFLVLFLAVVAVTALVGLGMRPPWVLAMLSRTMHASTQLPVRLALLILAGFFVLTENFGFESILGAFAAGMVVGVATRGHAGETLRQKLDAVCFGWFVPFFFIGTGVKFQLHAITGDLSTALLVPVFMLMLLAVRGAPVWVYRRHLPPGQCLPFALYCSVASLSLVVVITDIGVHTGRIDARIAAALVGAAVLSVLLFPTLATALLRRAEQSAGAQATAPSR